MKRYNNLFEKIVDLDNIKLAHKNASKGKKHYTEVKMFNTKPDFYARLIRKMLIEGTYKTSEYKRKFKNDKGKMREIFVLPYYPDRIIHHAIMQVLEPIWKKTFIANTYQSIKGRGVHKCKKHLENILLDREITDDIYCFKLDIEKFYPSINNEILKQILRRKIKCKPTLALLDNIIDSTEGVPIGNYISQFFGNLYLTYFDHYMKEVVGCKYYYRYCDDIVILDFSKSRLQEVKDITFKELSKLKLKVKGNYQIFKVGETPIERPIDFLGFKFYRQCTLLRDSIAESYRKCEARKEVFASYKGWLQHCDGYNLLRKYRKEKLNEN